MLHCNVTHSFYHHIVTTGAQCSLTDIIKEHLPETIIAGSTRVPALGVDAEAGCRVFPLSLPQIQLVCLSSRCWSFNQPLAATLTINKRCAVSKSPKDSPISQRTKLEIYSADAFWLQLSVRSSERMVTMVIPGRGASSCCLHSDASA